MHENEVSGVVVDASMKVHKLMGPGLLESVYQSALCYELACRGIHVASQQGIPIVYDGVPMGEGFRADMIVEGKVIVEIKSIESLAPIHAKVLLTYLRLTGCKLGLLINFREALLKDGIHRIVNNL